MSKEFNSTTPPTKEEFESFGGRLFDQVEATGWVGFGANSAFVQTASQEQLQKVEVFCKNYWRGKNSHVFGKSFEDEIAEQLSQNPDMKNIRRNVKCAVGIADIVCDGLIIECKVNPSRDAIFQAIGQVLMYRIAINQEAVAMVCVAIPSKSVDMVSKLIPYAGAIGVLMSCYELKPYHETQAKS